MTDLLALAQECDEYAGEISQWPILDQPRLLIQRCAAALRDAHEEIALLRCLALPRTPYDVTCARCGKVLPCTEAVAEEGDEWECWPCNGRCSARERAEREQ